MRALVAGEPVARGWLERAVGRELDVHAPDLVYAEVGQALARYARAGRLSSEQARVGFQLAAGLPLAVHGVQELAEAALELSLARGLSVYDACYAVVAELWDAVLVTADRRLAAAVPRSELVA